MNTRNNPIGYYFLWLVVLLPHLAQLIEFADKVLLEATFKHEVPPDTWIGHVDLLTLEDSAASLFTLDVALHSLQLA